MSSGNDTAADNNVNIAMDHHILSNNQSHLGFHVRK